METLENLEKAVDEVISVVTVQLETLREIKILLSSETLKGINIQSDFQLTNYIHSNEKSKTFNSTLYKEYPFYGKFPEKMAFLDKIHQQAWNLNERRELIIQIEGENKSKETLNGISGKIQNLHKSHEWIGAKYGGVNKYTFYVRPEWLAEDGLSIKPKYCPPEYLLQQLSEEKRKPENIKWLGK